MTLIKETVRWQYRTLWPLVHSQPGRRHRTKTNRAPPTVRGRDKWGNNKVRDTAAAQAVVESAGGLVTDTDMRPLRYNTKESLLNPHFLVFGDRGEDWGSYL